MITKIFTATTLGLQPQLIEVEIDISPALPSVVMVGLPDKAVQESKERIRAALKESGFEFPMGKVTINLAPADIIKSGTGFDLPIAVGILHLTGYIKEESQISSQLVGLNEQNRDFLSSKSASELSKKTLFLGELSLDGRVRPITGALSICLWARQNGFEQVFLPKENTNEVSLISNLKIFGVKTLIELVEHLSGGQNLTQIEPIDLKKLRKTFDLDTEETPLFPQDMAYIRGQAVAKRALEIAASGGHNVLFIGSPGSGKTLLARSYPTILPQMTEQEILEATQIYSVAGMLRDGKVMFERPFRAPHHSASHIALVGGGSKIRPGEISLAHRGVLFLDEFAEFSRESIEALRQPLEDGFVQISRASGTITFPAKFSLLAAANPTPSGFDEGDPMAANKPQNQGAIARYQAKFSGPIMDRIDLQVEVNRPKKEELLSQELAEHSIQIAKRVQNARDIQTRRFSNENIQSNSEMSLPLIQKYCQLDANGDKLISQAVDKFKLSARSYMRILKLSRTIADLAGLENIQSTHIAEALQYRGRWS